jgi:serine O-acetyltransferase
MFPAFRQDLARRFPAPRTWRICLTAFFEMSVWAVGIFRFGKRVQGIRFWLPRKVLLAVYFLLYKISEALSGIRISIYSEIGPGLVVHNFGGVLIHGRLGRNCTIVQGAQLLSRSDGKDSGWPTLGDDVYVGSGAKVLGNVHVGNNVRMEPTLW